MRVYELSKKLGLSNKELLDKLHDAGFDVVTHMSTLSQDAIDFFTKSKKQEPEQTKGPEKELQPESKQILVPKQEEKQIPSVHVEKELAPVKSEMKTILPLEKEGQKIFEISIPSQPMTVGQFAQYLHRPVSDVILTLLRQGIVSAKNQLLPLKTLENLAKHYQVKLAAAISVQEKVQPLLKSKSTIHSRPPVVVVIGHVDHGKTTLLDFIRKTKVAAKEQGGITQHLGAYQVTTPQGSIVFLDTPGHAAFTKMRARGLKVADIAILVVAADDGVMPQTVEAIKHAQAIQVPVIVAINKIDKATPAQIETVKRQLAQHNLVAEEWGGQTICVPISAKEGRGVDQLLEMIILQSQVMELSTDETAPAKGFVLEARMEKGRGAVATVLCQEGTLHIGDYFSAGNTHGKISSLVDSHAKALKKVGPSIPVQVAGFSGLPEAGDFFEVISQERYKAIKSVKMTTLEADIKKFTTGEAVNLLIKTDSKSSKEALLGSIANLGEHDNQKLHIVHTGVGDISEGDVTLAATTHAIIYGFHVKPETNAIALAQKNNVTIKLFQIIYRLLDDIELVIKQDEKTPVVKTKIGEAVVRRVFDIKNVGTIAGSYIREGRFSRNGHVIIWRGKTKVGEGAIKSLERDRKPVKEVHTGFECAFLVDGFNEWEVEDRVECFIDLPSK